MPGFGPCRGKGDAMWRALSATTGELVAYLDGDTRDFARAPAHRPARAALRAPRAGAGQGRLPAALRRRRRARARGGRPRDRAHGPPAAEPAPPRAGRLRAAAGRARSPRAASCSSASPSRSATAWRSRCCSTRAELAGIDALAQADLGTRQNRHQPLRELSAMSYAVLVAASRRLLGDDAVEALAPGPYVMPGAAEIDVRQVAVEERPALSRTRRSRGPSFAPDGPRRPSASSAAGARTRRA